MARSISPQRYRPVTRIDVAASMLARLAPKHLTVAVDQARRDAHAVLDGFFGHQELSYRSELSPARSPKPLAEIDVLEALLPRAARGRYLAIKRDVTVVVRGFQGQHPAPLFERRAKVLSRIARSTSTEQPSSTRRMRISALVRETADAVTLRLEDVAGAKVAFQAGQFLSVRADLNGETLWRAYSICAAPSSGELAITIKRVEGGRVSQHLNDGVKVNDVLETRGPSGRFTLAHSPTPRHVVLLGGGSGITPLISHVQHLLASEAHTRITLLYGNRAERDIIFKSALEGLLRKHSDRMVLRYVLSEPSETLACAVGVLDAETTRRELTQLGVIDAANTQYLICGPEPMMKASRAALLTLGVAEPRILEERFSGPGALARTSGAGLEPQTVAYNLKGKETRVSVKPGLTLLEAALAADVPLDFSCMMGGCGACMVKLVEGSVQMEEPSCLSASERAEGKILSCIARPTSLCRVEKI